MLNKVVPDIVHGMSKFLASGFKGKDRIHLRKRFEMFCDRVGLINEALSKQKEAKEPQEEAMQCQPSRDYLEYCEDLYMKKSHPRPGCFHGQENPLASHSCSILATQVKYTIPLLCNHFDGYWHIHKLRSAFGDENKSYGNRSWDKDSDDESSWGQPTWSECLEKADLQVPTMTWRKPQC
jgi:hypothetical protein